MKFSKVIVKYKDGRTFYRFKNVLQFSKWLFYPRHPSRKSEHSNTILQLYLPASLRRRAIQAYVSFMVGTSRIAKAKRRRS